MIKKPLPRRTFLKGAGVTMALPFLEAMLPTNRTWAAQKPKFAVLFSGVGMASDPNGSKMMHPEVRQILSPHLANTTYITGLINDGITNNHDELPGFMAGGNSSSYSKLTSVDRVVADLMNQDTIFKNGLFVGSQTRAGQSTSDIRKIMSHKQGSQSTLYHDPRVLFDLITTLGGFKGGSAPLPVNPTNPSNATKRDVLSLSLESIKSLKRQLSSQDNIILDQHLTAIEQIQKGLIELPATTNTNTCQSPAGIAASYPSDRGDARMPIIADIAAIAMNCELTRSLSFLVFPDGSGSTSAHTHLYDTMATYAGGERPGVGYHEWTHNRWSSPSDTSKSNEPQCTKAGLLADKFDAGIALRFLNGLSPATLESSAIVFGSGGGYNGSHPSSGEEGYHANIPFALFGKLNGAIRPRGATPLNYDGSVCNVWLTLLKNMGFAGNSFGTFRDPTKMISLV